MTTYSKPAVRNAWGQTASGSDLVDPGNTYASAGWQIGNKPPRQYFNWVLNYNMAGIRYLCQQGISSWDAVEAYPTNGITLASNGGLYRSVVPNNQGTDPASVTIGSGGARWDLPLVADAPAGDSSGRIASTSFVFHNYIAQGSGFSALSGQIQASQVPVGAITQWQGSLSISGTQITGSVNQANHVFNTSGQYATFNWSGQSGQPTWLWGSNDGLNYYIWNPANFSVANATTVSGLSPTIAAAGSTVVVRDSSGNIYSSSLNQSSPNNENPSISQFMVTNGVDGFQRKASVAAVKAALGALTSANFAFSSGGYQKIADQAIIQGGRATISGLTAVFFPIAFPHGCFAVVFVNEGTTNQIFLNSPPGTTFFQATNGNAVIDWIAFGW